MMNFDQLSPSKTSFILEGDAVTLSPFSLRLMVDLGNSLIPGEPEKGLSFLNGELTPDQIVKLAYYFIEDKDIYPTICTFRNAIKRDKHCTVLTLKEAVFENIRNSQAVFDEKDIEAIKEQAEKQDNPEPQNWANIYVTFAMAIPLTLDQFYEMTMRQIHAIMKEILTEKQKKIEFDASLFGKQVKTTGRKKRTVFKKEADEKLTSLAEQDLKQWQSKANKNY